MGEPVVNGSVFRLLVGLIVATPIAFFYLSVAFGPVATAIVVHLNLFGKMPHGGFNLAAATAMVAESLPTQGLMDIQSLNLIAATDTVQASAPLGISDTPQFDEEQQFKPQGADVIHAALSAVGRAAGGVGAPAYQRQGGPFHLFADSDYYGKDITHKTAIASPDACGKLCLQAAAPEAGGCGFFTYREHDGNCYLKPLKDKMGKLMKIDLRKSSAHVAGDIKGFLNKKCDGACWNRMRIWMIVTMFIGMTLAAIVITSVIHDLDLLRLRGVPEPLSKQRKWLSPYDLTGDYVAEMATTCNMTISLGLLAWIILGSFWAWSCACSSCHHTALWKALNAYLIAVWLAGVFTWIVMVFFALLSPMRPVVTAPPEEQLVTTGLKQIEVVPAYYPQYKQEHPVVHRWSQYY